MRLQPVKIGLREATARVIGDHATILNRWHMRSERGYA
jgi:hypothetical protein